MEIKNTPDVYVSLQIKAAAAIPNKMEVPVEKNETIPAEPITKEKLVEKVDSMNDFLEPTNTSIKFNFHEELGEFYVQVIDAFTDEVLKEIPNKKFLDMYASMAEFAGILIDKKL